MRATPFERRCHGVIERLDVGSPLDVRRFLASVSIEIGRPVSIGRGHWQGVAPVGMVLRGIAGDHLFIERTLPGHASHTLFHLAAHLLLGHATLGHCGLWGLLGTPEVPGDDAEGQWRQDDAEEAEAVAMAGYLQAHVRRLRDYGTRAGLPSHARMQLYSALGPQGRVACHA